MRALTRSERIEEIAVHTNRRIMKVFKEGGGGRRRIRVGA
jgi:hypothetical protein